MSETVRSPGWRLGGHAADAALAGGLAVAVIGLTVLPNDVSDISVLGWLLMVAGSGAVYFRRRYPLTVTLLTLAASVAYLIIPDPDGPIVLTLAVALYTLMSVGRIRSGIVVGIVVALLSFYGEYLADGENLGQLGVLFFVAWLIAVMAVGGAVYNRRAYLREADQRVLDAERNREEELRRRTTEERLRIARELHDVLGHTISLINVQAGAALHRITQQPEQAEQALDAIRKHSHEALRELRTTLGVLRQVDEGAPTAPAPSLSKVRELIAGTQTAGLTIQADISGDPARPLPPAVDLAGFRIVQEALTNVARHAAATTATVRIAYGDDAVRIDVDDNGSGGVPGDGSGIIGMKERAGSVGGEIQAGPRPGGGFRVRARLPLEGDR